MLFKESKKRERPDQKQELKPAWEDPSVGQIKVDINTQSRLRKLKQDEDENMIEGQEFSKRLKKQHQSIIQSSSLFDWATQP